MSGRKMRKEEQENSKPEAQAEQVQDAPVAEPVTEGLPVPCPECEELKRQLAEKTALAQAYFAQLQRVQADFENYQKRVNADRARIADQACEALIAGMLDTLDNFERAAGFMKNLPGEDAKGINMVYETLLGYLRENGLERIVAAGCQFDPRRHEAIMQAEDPAAPDGTVLEEFQAGYTVKGRVVRPSKVKVARKPIETHISSDDKKEE